MVRVLRTLPGPRTRRRKGEKRPSAASIMTFRDTNGDFLNGPGHNDENGLSLHDNVRRSVQRFLRKNRHAEPEDLYHILLEQVEKPLIAEVLRWTGGNQSRCAEVLGISRGKLRQRIQHYKL